MGDEIQVFKEFLEERGLRLTRQREAIIRKVFTFENHFCAEDLAQWATDEGKAYGLVTIYRTLALALECGLVEEREFGRGRKYFDKVHGRGHHEHFICRTCGEVQEIWDERFGDLQRELSARIGFVPDYYDLRIFGTCAKCVARPG